MHGRLATLRGAGGPEWRRHRIRRRSVIRVRESLQAVADAPFSDPDVMRMGPKA
ncbi:hypothetical protein GCM10007854_19690 [Algimonas porphyrae]|uniref:Uncharacterized protein n=1 Tax=Algimonas porphyrae TaxID=1128113 RepID=A0ABQ5V2T4_9PROT|nr:hypothetical protein GCM10007854_19690 [Algimonas porphyrae]